MASVPDAKAQSGCPQIVTGAVLTAAQWNNCFTRKSDYLGYVPLNPSNLIAVSPITLTSVSGIISLGFNFGTANTWTMLQTMNGGLTVTSSFTATGLVTNADLVNPSITISGVTCTLGASCTPANVFGPSSATDNALARFDGTTGKSIQNSTAVLSDNGTLTLNTTAASATQGFNILQSGPTTGTTAGVTVQCQLGGQAYFAYNNICISSDAANVTGSPNPSTVGLAVGMVTGGANSDWNKAALDVSLNHTTASNAAHNRDNVAAGFGFSSSASEGGTDTGAGAKGTGFGSSSACILQAGAVNYFGCVGSEFAVGIQTGASSRLRWAVSAISNTDLQATGIDAAFVVGGTSGGPGWQNGIIFENLNGGIPISTTGCIMCNDGSPNIVGKGFDFASWTVTGNFITGPGSTFAVTGTGFATSIGLAVNDGTVNARFDPTTLFSAALEVGTVSNHNVVFVQNNTLAGYFDTGRVFNLGLAGFGQGKLAIHGTTSGVITQTTNAVAGTATITWGTGSGTPAVTASSPLAIDSAGNITCSGCTGTLTLTNTHIYVGNGSNVATDVALSGDATLANTGAMTIANNAVTFAKMQAIGANTIMGNPTAGAAVPSALSAPSCSTSASALIYITNTGFNCNSSIAAASAPVSGLTGAGTGVLTALAINVGTAGALVVLNGALGSPSSAGTIPAFTLGGDIAGSGNHMNNVIIGNTGPQAAVFTALEADNAVFFKGLTVAAGTPNSICQNSATKEVTVNAALTCTVSSMLFKHNIRPIELSASSQIMAMRPVAFSYNDSERDRIGFIAEELAGIDRRLADGWDDYGNPRSIDQNAILAQLVKNAQEIMTRIGALEAH